jgi:hypothetical protein
MGYDKHRYATDPEYRERSKAVRRAWDEANKPARKQWKLLNRYGLSMQDFEAILADQNWACGICRRKFGDRSKKPCVDHCHKTRKVRGLLCIKCNMGLGYFDDDPTFARMAADYLEKWRRIHEGQGPTIPATREKKSSKKQHRKDKT